MMRFRYAAVALVLGALSALAPAATIERRMGDFVVQVSDDGGAFNMRYAPETSSPVNFFVSHDDFASTYFSVMMGDTVYKLRRGSVSSISILEDGDSIGLRYSIRNRLNASIDFTFAEQYSGEGLGAVKVEVRLENISSKAQDVALKGVFDTLLGENSGIHFVTSRFPYVSSEESFTDMGELQWVRSSNGNESVQFLFDGNGISRPKLVALANKELVAGDGWLPVTKSGRTFNSVFSYNNSAVCALWETMSLTPATSGSITFYVTFASKARIPPTAKFLGERQEIGNLTDDDKIVYSDGHGVVYTVGDLTDSMLNAKYIEDLLRRIRKLEEDPENIDRNELLRLNAELDAILEKIRRL